MGYDRFNDEIRSIANTPEFFGGLVVAVMIIELLVDIPFRTLNRAIRNWPMQP